MQKGDHPKLDMTPFLDEKEKEIFMSLVGSVQWAISIGIFDIQSAIMTMSKFCNFPRKGHLEKMRRVIGFMCKIRHYMICFCVDEPEYANVPGIKNHDWEHSVYGKHKEDVPGNAPPPLGK